jgi:phage terminase large subunit GpA-like protein
MPFDGQDGYVLALEAAARGFRPRQPLSIALWAARYRRLSGKAAAEPGPWRNERIPYLAGIMDVLDVSHPAPLVVFVKSSQVGGSECGLNWIGRTIHMAPAPILALFPSEKSARKWVRARLNSMLAETPELRVIIPAGRRSDQGNTLLEKHYREGVLYTGSAGIPDDVAGITVPYVLLDEVDRMPLFLDNEGDPIELAKARAYTFPGRTKIFEISTPTIEETSRIWADWLSSTQDRYFVPCPLCLTMQWLTFDNLKWADGKPEEAQYQCEECGELFGERHKTGMLEAGAWRAEHPEREHLVKGFHVNALYTPIGLGDSWVDHARKWDSVRGNAAKVQVFYNTRRGEVVKSDKIKLEWEAVAARREPYRLRTIPPGILQLSAGADIQGDRIEAGIVGWGRGERAAVIDYTTFYGDPTRPEVWQALDDWHAKEILNSHGVAMRIQCLAVDSGNWQHEVTNWTRTRRARGIIATKGSQIRTRHPIGKPTLVDVNYRGVSQKRGAEQYQIGVSVMKTTLYARLAADAEATPATRHVRFSEELTDEFFRQLCAEKFDPKEGWHKHYDRNEGLDVLILATAAAMHQSMQIHRLREADWIRLESLYEPHGERAKAADPVLGEVPIPRRGGGFLPISAKVKN